MSLARVATRCRQGISASIVWVEAHLSPGLPTIALVGVSATVVKEAKERAQCNYKLGLRLARRATNHQLFTRRGSPSHRQFGSPHRCRHFDRFPANPRDTRG
jgi:hypothetical protein